MNDMRFHETNAILRMLGIKLGYYDPKDANCSHWNDCIMDKANDALGAGMGKIIPFLKNKEMDSACKEM